MEKILNGIAVVLKAVVGLINTPPKYNKIWNNKEFKMNDMYDTSLDDFSCDIDSSDDRDMNSEKI